MPEKHLYTIATFDEETSKQMKALEHILNDAGITGRQTPDIPPHITLCRYSPAFEEEIKLKLHGVCASARSFDLVCNHLGLFGLRVLFLAPNVKHELLDLFGSLRGGKAAGIGEWTPHVTLLIDEADAILKALPLVAAHFKPLKARVTAVSLYEFFPMRFVAECRLK